MSQKNPKRTRIRGKYWQLESQSDLPEGDLGECNYELSSLRVPIQGDTKEELDIIIHEFLHAAYPDLNESAVDIAATDLARLLWRLGWRKDDFID